LVASLVPPEEIVSSRRDSRTFWPAADVLAGGDVLVRIVANGRYLGALALSRPGALDDRERDALELVARATGMLASRRIHGAIAEDQEREDLLADMLHGVAPGALAGRLRACGLRSTRLNTVVVASAEGAGLDREMSDLAPDFEGLAGGHQGLSTLVIHAEDAAGAAAEVHRRLEVALDAPILVCAGDATGMRWQQAFALTARCCRLLGQLGVHDAAATPEQFGAYALLLDPDPSSGLESFMDRTLGPLLEYDAKRRTELVDTVAAYFDQAGSNVQTAKALHVHLNTLLKRMGRIETLLGPGWRTSEQAFELQLAVRLQRLAQRAGRYPPRREAPARRDGRTKTLRRRESDNRGHHGAD
jgi:PucR C-terminal helix-turn-helix domain